MCARARDPRPSVEVEKLIFESGPSLILRRDRSLPLAAVRCYVRGGSIGEWPPGGRGTAHLVEHLVATRAAESMQRSGDGALLNALTSRELTCYYWSVLGRDCPSSVRSFLGALSDPADWLPAQLAAQKEVVAEEIDLFTSNPLAAFRQRFLEELFLFHPIRYPVCGYRDGLETVTTPEVEGYLVRRYGGANLSLVVVGDFDADELAAAVDELGSALGVGERFTQPQAEAEPVGQSPRSFRMELAGETGFTEIGFRAALEGEPDALALSVLAEDLNRSPSNGLRRQLLRSGAAQELVARHTSTTMGAGFFSILLEHPPGCGEAVGEEVRGWLGRLSRGEEEVDLVWLSEGAEAADDGFTLDGWSAVLGEGEARLGDPLRGLERQRRRREVTRGQVAAAVARRCSPQSLVVGYLEPRAAGPRPCPPGPRCEGSEHRPGAARREGAGVSRGKTRRATGRGRSGGRAVPASLCLANSVRVVVVPTPHPQVCCQLLWRGGVLVESESDNGLCSLTTRLLPDSLAPTWSRRLEALRRESGSGTFAFCDPNFAGVSLTTRAERLEAGLEILAEMALRPRFRAETFEGERERTAGWLAGAHLSHEQKALIRLKRRFFQSHPYRMEEIGTPASLRALSLEQAEACHRRLCLGGNTVVVVAGRVRSSDEVLEDLGELFGGIPEGALQVVDGVEAPPSDRAVLGPEAADEGACEGRKAFASASHASLALGYCRLPWRAEDWYALEMLKTLLVGPESNSVTGRLIRATREQGAAYSLSCHQEAGFGDGYFAVSATFSPSKGEPVLAIVEEEIERLCRGEIRESELEHGRKLYLLSRMLSYESPRAQAYAVGRQVFFSGELGGRQSLAARFESLRVDDLVSVARRTFRPAVRAVVIEAPEGAAHPAGAICVSH